MQATQTRTTPLAEARNLRADAFFTLRDLILEHPRRPGWSSLYPLVFQTWAESNNLVKWLERRN